MANFLFIRRDTQVKYKLILKFRRFSNANGHPFDLNASIDGLLCKTLVIMIIDWYLWCGADENEFHFPFEATGSARS